MLARFKKSVWFPNCILKMLIFNIQIAPSVRYAVKTLIFGQVYVTLKIHKKLINRLILTAVF